MVKDEPVKDLLGIINRVLIQRLLECKYSVDKSAIPTINYLAIQSKAVPETLPSVTRMEVGNSVTYKFGSELPKTESWFQTLAGSELNWLFALIFSPTIVLGTSYVDNALHCILVPQTGQKVLVKYAGSLPLSVTVYGAAPMVNTYQLLRPSASSSIQKQN